MAFRMEEQSVRDGERLYKATCFECGVIVATLASAAKSKSARREHRCNQ